MATSNQHVSDSYGLDADSPQSGTVLWLMGPTSAGKTTLASRLVAHLRQSGVPAIFYDGDEIRDFFGSNLGFTSQERFRVVSVLAHLANKAADAGLHVVVAAVTASQDARDYVRDNVRNLKVGYISCSIDTCAQRDPKGLYRKAISGEIDTLIGYNGEYRAPVSPDLVLDTEAYSVDELVSQIVALYVKK
jgi:adenylylsulfate kinase